MRKITKDKILQLIETVKYGVEMLLSVSICELIEILVEAQNALLCIIDIINKSDEYESKLVNNLENFLSKLYELNILSKQNKLTELEVKNTWEDCNLLKKELDSKLICKLEIVFMPYKVSMWDSLESIYYAVKKDENCNAVVMPVPYYNLGFKRHILNVTYEGEQFPDCIDITDYRKYNLQEKCPDVIFIHNPYDNKNLVVQLPEMYFSSNLIKYTNHLIYIPYKVCSGAVKDIYCVTPGVFNSWRTFVQSEIVRKVYIKYHNSKKIVTIGSPKVDKLIYYESHKPPIPQEWKNALEGRKIFLLNIHLSSIINKPNDLIGKLKDLITIFSAREDIAIIWRPHPLSIDTMKSINPNMIKKYYDIVEKFNKMENGIYDETIDVHKTMALTDAYIGNWSSLVSLYGLTGKPILIMDMHTGIKNLVERNSDCLRMGAAHIEEKRLLFFARDFNKLYEYDLQSKFISLILDMSLVHRGRVEKMYKLRDKLMIIMAGMDAGYYIYHLKNSQLYKMEQGQKSPNKIYRHLKRNEYIYLIPKKFTDFGFIDFEKEIYIEIISCKEYEDKVVKDAALIGDDILILLEKEKNILKYNIIYKKWNCISLQHIVGNILCMVTGEEYIYLLIDTFKILVCDTALKILHKYCHLNDFLESDNTNKCRILSFKSKIVLLSSNSNKIIVLDDNKHSINSITYPNDLEIDTDNFLQSTESFAYDFLGNELILFPKTINMLIKIDLDKITLKIDKIKYNSSLEETLINLYNKRRFSSIYKESVCGLEYYINSVVNNNDLFKSSRMKEFYSIFYNTEGTSGKNIWEYVKENM